MAMRHQRRSGSRSRARIGPSDIFKDGDKKIFRLLPCSESCAVRFISQKPVSSMVTAADISPRLGKKVQELSMGVSIKQFVRDESGATAIEYGLIAAGISVAIIAVVQALGTNLNATFRKYLRKGMLCQRQRRANYFPHDWS